MANVKLTAKCVRYTDCLLICHGSPNYLIRNKNKQQPILWKYSNQNLLLETRQKEEKTKISSSSLNKPILRMAVIQVRKTLTF